MKKLKRICIAIAFPLIMGMLVAACGDSETESNEGGAVATVDNPKNDETSSKTNSDNSASSTNIETGANIAESQNSGDNSNLGVNVLLDRIHILESDISAMKKESETYKKALDENKKSISDMDGKYIWVIIALVEAAIAVLLSCWSVYKLANLSDSLRKHKKMIGELHRDLQLESQSNGTNGVTYAQMQRKLKSLEEEISKLRSANSRRNHPTPSERYVPGPSTQQVEPPAVREKTGWFGMPSQMSPTEGYFNALLDSRDQSSVFQAVVRGDVAEFRPLDGQGYLNMIKSSDLLRNFAIDCIECAPSEARGMTVDSPGKAVKNGDKWEIRKKTTVILTR